jgi:hypothetical protein
MYVNQSSIFINGLRHISISFSCGLTVDSPDSATFHQTVVFRKIYVDFQRAHSSISLLHHGSFNHVGSQATTTLYEAVDESIG